MIYSFSVTFTVDVSLFFYYDEFTMKNILEPIHTYISWILASYCYLLCYKNIETMFVDDYFRTNVFEWRLSFNSLYMIGVLYSSFIFYLTEFIYFFINGTSEYLNHRLLLVTPSSMFVLTFLETFLCLDSLRITYVNRAVAD
jgi:hypothetical protein